jgi:hypothetical protein
MVRDFSFMCGGFRLTSKVIWRAERFTSHSVNHMRVAIRAAQSAREIEQANDTKVLGSWFDDMMMHVPVSVIMSAAALEATCNEIIQDILDGRMHVTSDVKDSLRDLKGDRSGYTLGRYSKLAAFLGNKVPPDQARDGADTLIKFRNAFIHFKPAWDKEADVHDGTLVQRLKAAQVPISPPYQRGGFMFPYGFMTYGCAKWCVESARRFSAEFANLIGVADRLAGGETLP